MPYLEMSSVSRSSGNRISALSSRQRLSWRSFSITSRSTSLRKAGTRVRLPYALPRPENAFPS